MIEKQVLVAFREGDKFYRGKDSTGRPILGDRPLLYPNNPETIAAVMSRSGLFGFEIVELEVTEIDSYRVKLIAERKPDKGNEKPIEES